MIQYKPLSWIIERLLHELWCSRHELNIWLKFYTEDGCNCRFSINHIFFYVVHVLSLNWIWRDKTLYCKVMPRKCVFLLSCSLVLHAKKEDDTASIVWFTNNWLLCVNICNESFNKESLIDKVTGQSYWIELVWQIFIE